MHIRKEGWANSMVYGTVAHMHIYSSCYTHLHCISGKRAGLTAWSTDRYIHLHCISGKRAGDSNSMVYGTVAHIQ